MKLKICGLQLGRQSQGARDLRPLANQDAMAAGDEVWQVRIPANVTDDSGDRDRCWCCAM